MTRAQGFIIALVVLAAANRAGYVDRFFLVVGALTLMLDLVVEGRRER